MVLSIYQIPFRRVPGTTPTIAASVLGAETPTDEANIVEVGITVPAALEGSVLGILVAATEPLVGLSDPLLETISTRAQKIVDDQAGGLLYGYAFSVSGPSPGAHTVSFEFEGACTPVIAIVVMQNAQAGSAVGETGIEEDELGTAVSRVEITPIDHYSASVDLAVSSDNVTFIPFYGQVAVGDPESGDLWARMSYKGELNRGITQYMGWRFSAQASRVMHLALTLQQRTGEDPDPPAEAELLSFFPMDGTGSEEPDTENGLSTGTWVNPERGVGTIAVGGAGSTGFNGTDTRCVFPNVAPVVGSDLHWQHAAMTFVGYAQIDDAPAAGTHRHVANRDLNQPAGGWEVSVRRNAGNTTTRLRAYVRPAAASSAVFVNAASDGVVDVTPDVAFKWALVFDPEHATEQVRLLFEADGGAASQVGTIAASTGQTDNLRNIFVGEYHNGADAWPGVQKNFAVYRGALSLAAFEALPAPVSVAHGTPTIDITVSNISLGNLAPNSVTDVDIAPFATGLTGGSLNFTEVSDAAGRATFVNDNTANALIRITMPATDGAPTNENATFTVSEDGGAASNVFQVSWTRPAAPGGGGASFPFVTIARPANVNQGLPPFNATNPRSVSRIDPMSGLEYWQILPHHASRQGNGEMIFANGSDTGFHVRAIQKQQSSPNDNSWNCDGTRLLLSGGAGRSLDDQSGGPITGSVLIRTSDWRITHVDIPNLGSAFWHPDNPDVLIRWSNTLQYRQYNVVTGADSALFTLNGYACSTTNGGNDDTTNPGRNGYTRKWGGANPGGGGGARYQAMYGRRTADNRMVLFRVRLDNGTKSGDIDFGPVVADNNAASWAVIDGDRYTKGSTPRISASGRYLLLVPAPGRNVGAFIPPAAGATVSAANAWAGTLGAPPLTASHPDTAIVNGDDIVIGQGTGNPTQMSWWNIDTGVLRRLASIPDGGNPYTISCQGRMDRFETYGAAGGGTTGRRYSIHGKVNGLWGIRIGPNDVDQIRFLGNPRGTTDGDDDLQTDPVADPTGRYVVWASNWRGGGGGVGGSGPPCTTYITALPEAWYSENNNGDA